MSDFIGQLPEPQRGPYRQMLEAVAELHEATNRETTTADQQARKQADRDAALGKLNEATEALARACGVDVRDLPRG